MRRPQDSRAAWKLPLNPFLNRLPNLLLAAGLVVSSAALVSVEEDATGSITGRVTAFPERALEDLVVRAEQLDRETEDELETRVVTTKTDDSGSFTLSNLAAARYRVELEPPEGYEAVPEHRDVEVHEREVVAEIDFHLEGEEGRREAPTHR